MSVPLEDVNMTTLIVNHTKNEPVNQTLSVLDCASEPFDPSAYFYWFDGVLVAALALVGTVGNVLALIVLARPRLRDVFHQLLFTLALFDLIYIICGGINYTFRAFR